MSEFPPPRTEQKKETRPVFFFGWLARRAQSNKKKTRPVFFFGWPAAHGAKKTRPVFFLVGWPAAHGTKKKTRPVFSFCWSARRARSQKKNAPRVFFFGRPAAHGATKKNAPRVFFLVGPPPTEQKSVIYKKAHRTKKKNTLTHAVKIGFSDASLPVSVRHANAVSLDDRRFHTLDPTAVAYRL